MSLQREDLVADVSELNWPILRNGDGPHLFFGEYFEVPNSWEVVDFNGENGCIDMDLIEEDWPWHDVAAIHCVSMLYQWTPEQAREVISNCYSSLKPAGILWLGEGLRLANLSTGRLSGHTVNSLTMDAEQAGFNVKNCHNILGITGRPSSRMFALRCVKP